MSEFFTENAHVDDIEEHMESDSDEEIEEVD